MRGTKPGFLPKPKLDRHRVEEFGISMREAEVLRWVATGRSNGKVAYQMNLSEDTIKSHMCRVLRKITVPDRTGAISFCWAMGIFEPLTVDQRQAFRAVVDSQHVETRVEERVKFFTESVGAQVRLARQDQGLSLRDVADHVGMTEAALRTREMGRREFDSRQLRVICRELGLDMAVVLARAEEAEARGLAGVDTHPRQAQNT